MKKFKTFSTIEDIDSSRKLLKTKQPLPKDYNSYDLIKDKNGKVVVKLKEKRNNLYQLKNTTKN